MIKYKINLIKLPKIGFKDRNDLFCLISTLSFGKENCYNYLFFIFKLGLSECQNLSQKKKIGIKKSVTKP